jgi:hypothetical protein
LFSLRVIRISISYLNFSKKASKTEEIAERMLQSGNIDLTETIKFVQEYHLARAAAPLIPTWVWKQRAPVLNELWKSYRQKLDDTDAKQI